MHGSVTAHLVVQHNQVAVLEVEAVQLVARGFAVEHIFVDDKGGAFGVVGDALADLAGRGGQYVRVFTQDVRITHRMGPNLPKRSKSSSGVTV